MTNIHPKRVDSPRFQVAGVRIRTANSEELSAETAKIPQLWARFFSEDLANTVPGRISDTPILGAYSAYETDATGRYDVTAGVVVAAPAPDFSHIIVHDGPYLVFEACGPMPDAIIDGWKSIWDYFARHPQTRRAYLTDFESYCGEDEVHIHIGITA